MKTNKLIKLFFIILLVKFSILSAFANVYEYSKSNINDLFTKTAYNLTNSFSKGDRIVIKAGTIKVSDIGKWLKINNLVGTKDSPIFIEGELGSNNELLTIIDGNGFTLTGSGQNAGSLLDINNSSYVTVKNIKFKNAYSGWGRAGGINFNSGSNLVIENCSFENTEKNVIYSNDLNNSQTGSLTQTGITVITNTTQNNIQTPTTNSNLYYTTETIIYNNQPLTTKTYTNLARENLKKYINKKFVYKQKLSKGLVYKQLLLSRDKINKNIANKIDKAILNLSYTKMETLFSNVANINKTGKNANIYKYIESKVIVDIYFN